MKILITGAAGFIGFFLAKELIKTGHNVIGLDNLNEYYPVQLKLDRLSKKGIEISKIEYGSFLESLNFDNYKFIQADLTDKEFIDSLFRTESFDLIINLAAQAGVRYSIENPGVYVSSNIVGFSNILDASVKTSVKFLLYASSSSVYGNNDKIPFSEDDEVRSPASVYAATKLADELLAATYNHLYQLPSIGLRFFYGIRTLGKA
jgi:UDP-glucuronate 4-epimerase